MAMNLRDVTGQTWEFPAAASAVNESNSIYVGGHYEIIGIEWEAMEATSNKIKLEIASVANALSVADASATFNAVVDKDGSAIVLTATLTAAGRMFFDPSAILLGPCRVRLAVYAADGTTAVNQDGQIVYPIFREV